MLLNESGGITRPGSTLLFFYCITKREPQVILRALRESKDRLHIVSDVSAIWMKARGAGSQAALFSNPGSSLCTLVLCLLSSCQVRIRLMRGHLAGKGTLVG